MTRTPRFRQIAMAAAALALTATACSTDGDQVTETESAEEVTPSSIPTDEQPTITATRTPDDGAPSVDPICRPGPGKIVEDLDGVQIPAVRVADFESPDEVIGDTRIPGVQVDGFELPAQTVDGGCIVYHDAPGGCLGKVEISATALPEGSIPDAEIAPVVVDGETLFEGAQVDGGRAERSIQDGSMTEQVCRVTTNDRHQPGVSRPAISRPALSRPAFSRPGLSRPAICVDAGDGTRGCTDSVQVDSVSVSSVHMDSVAVDSDHLDSVNLDEAPETDVVSGEDREAYVTPAELLFDFDKAELKPVAAPTLEAIVAKLAELPDGTEIQVDGHTDDKGTDAYNDDLSERRADAVAQWLRSNGVGPADQITTTGYGESAPAAPNDTEENRAKNRRVVISAPTT